MSSFFATNSHHTNTNTHKHTLCALHKAINMKDTHHAHSIIHFQLSFASLHFPSLHANTHAQTKNKNEKKKKKRQKKRHADYICTKFEKKG